MVDGFFSMVFTGRAGSGFGVLALHKGVVAGTDVAGASYDGQYRENPDTHALDVEITMNAPAGVTPVQTGEALVSAMTLPITASVREEDLGTDRPTLLQTPLGPVNLLLRKIRDFPTS